jgi:hypothetical protein
MSGELVTRRFEPRAQLLEVVDLTVLNDPNRAVLVADRLVAAGDVDDAQAAITEDRLRFVRRRLTRDRHHAFIVRAAMAHRRAHRADERFRRVSAVELNETSDTAHQARNP